MSVEQFKTGDNVRYVPNHAHGDVTHEDCEIGIVTSTNDTYVFVRFTHPRARNHPQACDPLDLRHMS